MRWSRKQWKAASPAERRKFRQEDMRRLKARGKRLRKERMMRDPLYGGLLRTTDPGRQMAVIQRRTAITQDNIRKVRAKTGTGYWANSIAPSGSVGTTWFVPNAKGQRVANRLADLRGDLSMLKTMAWHVARGHVAVPKLHGYYGVDFVPPTSARISSGNRTQRVKASKGRKSYLRSKARR